MRVFIVQTSRRDDGGLRVWSSDLPGLILSGKNADAVLGDIPTAVVSLLQFRGHSVTDAFVADWGSEGQHIGVLPVIVT